MRRLGLYQRVQRQHAAHSTEAQQLMRRYNYSGLFSLGDPEFDALAIRLRVPKSILTYNATKLEGLCRTFLRRYATFRQQFYNDEKRVYRNVQMTREQMAVVLEFFLQFDGTKLGEIIVVLLSMLNLI